MKLFINLPFLVNNNKEINNNSLKYTSLEGERQDFVLEFF